MTKKLRKNRISCSRLTDRTRFTATPKVGGVPLLNYEPLNRRKAVINTWEKAESLAKLVAHRRTLLVLDGLESLQNPPGSKEGRLREPSLQALLRELAAFNMGLCMITDGFKP